MENAKARKVNYPFLSEAEEESLRDAIVLDPPVLDEAIMGVIKNDRGDPIFVYDHEELIRCHAREEFGPHADNDPTAFQQAFEWISFNTIQSLHGMGERAPIVLVRVDDECLEDIEGDDVRFFDGRCWTHA